MQKLDSKKLTGVLRQIENAGKGAVRVLNEQTGGHFKDSDLEKNPLDSIGHIVRILQNGIAQADQYAKYDGMDEDQIEEAKAAEREAERVNLQKSVQEKLAKRKPQEPEPEPDGDKPEEPGESNPPQE